MMVMRTAYTDRVEAPEGTAGAASRLAIERHATARHRGTRILAERRALTARKAP